MKNSINIKDKFQKMPPDLQKEVMDYIDFLLQKNELNNGTPDKQNFKFDWEGGLLELKNKFTSVELQHKVLEWR